ASVLVVVGAAGAVAAVAAVVLCSALLPSSELHPAITATITAATPMPANRDSLVMMAIPPNQP
ncbi:MAG: hypothetical protein WCZ29_26990, partial [Mycolicibacterium vanbaalenii]